MQFEGDQIYHVYNRGNRSIPIFYKPRNYDFFLKKLSLHIKPHASILAYCLMPNHFHLMLRTNIDLMAGALNNDIGILLRSYTRAINKQQGTSGSLFQSGTKAKDIGSKKDLPLICFNYIHLNPVKAKIVDKPENWKYSSYPFFAEGIQDGLTDLSALMEILDIDLEGYKKSIFTYLMDERLEKHLFE